MKNYQLFTFWWVKSLYPALTKMSTHWYIHDIYLVFLIKKRCILWNVRSFNAFFAKKEHTFKNPPKYVGSEIIKSTANMLIMLHLVMPVVCYQKEMGDVMTNGMLPSLVSEIDIKYVSKITKQVKDRDCPWQNSNWNQIMDIRDRAKVKADTSRCQEDFENYQTSQIKHDH